MNKMINQRILYILPIIFLVVILYRVLYTFQDVKEREYQFAKTEAEVVTKQALTYREYYQQLFVDKVLTLDASTLSALPAFSSHIISENFSKNNAFDISVRTVSDRARNPKNQLHESEKRVFEYLKSHPDEETYFSDEDDRFYHYASALRIEQKCLRCHDTKERAPSFIRDRYDKAYGYKLGDLRGMLIISIPKEKISVYYKNYFQMTLVYDFVLFFLLFALVYYITQKTKNFNDILEMEVQSKTLELKESLSTERLTQLPNRLKLLEDVSHQ